MKLKSNLHTSLYPVKSDILNNFNQAYNYDLSTETIDVLFSKFGLKCSSHYFKEAALLQKHIYGLRQNEPYLQACHSHDSQVLDFKDNFLPSLFSSLDFHLTENGLKLIEINTNASAFLGAILLEPNLPKQTQLLEELPTHFKKSFAQGADHLIITDDQPEAQKMFFEFEALKNFLLNTKTYSKVSIMDTKELNDSLSSFNSPIHIYNRNCDFYLDSFPALRAYCIEKKMVSPHPAAYGYFAQKDRLPLIKEHLPEKFHSYFLSAEELTSSNAEDYWTKRKKYFFKPLDSYGSKSVYSGSSISKTKFQTLIDQNILAQELAKPLKLVDPIESEAKQWKFDLRLYTFGPDIFHSIARVYRGQLTQFSSSDKGGFSGIDWT